jgi:DNA-binding NarL/FixJ family response regulator
MIHILIVDDHRLVGEGTKKVLENEQDFYNHWKNWASLASYDTDLVVGDAVNADFAGDGHIDHTAIVTKIENGQRKVTQHSVDRKDASLSVWFNNGYKVYGWKMGTDAH